MPPASGTIAAQFWMDAAPWRLTAGWSLVAALAATGVLFSPSALDLRGLVLLWLLVDPIWGALWRLAGGRRSLLPLRTGSNAARPSLPYLRPTSPAAQLLNLDENNALPYLVHVALPALVVSLIVSAALGVQALVSTALLALVTVAGWTLRSTLNVPPLLLHAVVIVALPWALTLVQGPTAPGSAPLSAIVLLGLLWTIHAWGEARICVWPQDRLALVLLAVAQAGVVLNLIVNKAPIGVPIVAALVLPTWLRVARGQPLNGLSLWWVAAMLGSALALGWR